MSVQIQEQDSVLASEFGIKLHRGKPIFPTRHSWYRRSASRVLNNRHNQPTVIFKLKAVIKYPKLFKS